MPFDVHRLLDLVCGLFIHWIHFFSRYPALWPRLGLLDGTLKLYLGLKKVDMLLLKLSLLNQVLNVAVANSLWVGVLEVLVQQKIEEQGVLPQMLSAGQTL